MVKVGPELMSGDELVMSFHCHSGGSGYCLTRPVISSGGLVEGVVLILASKHIFFMPLPCKVARMVVV